MKPLTLLLILFFPLLDAKTTPARAGKDYAVFFYVTDYDDRRWPTLPNTKTECEKIADELTDKYGFDCEFARNPTKEQIREKIRACNERAYAPGDQVLFFFSMHGHYDADLDRGFLVARDGKLDDKYGDSWYSYDDLGTDLARSHCQHILLALDACHSGAFGVPNAKAKPVGPDFKEEPDCAKKISGFLQYKTRLYCCSGHKEDKTDGESLFAARWLEALRKGGDDGVMSFNDLQFHLGKIQKPKYDWGKFKGHDGGDFVFVRKEGCGTAPEPGGEVKPPAQNDFQRDLSAWEKVKAFDTPEAYQKYLDDFPGGAFREAAEAKIAAKKGAAKTAPPATPAKKIEDKPDNGFVLVRGGTFTMGSPETEVDRSPDETQHTVTLSDFYIAKTEVTQKLWAQVKGSNPSDFKGVDLPVENVSWDAVQDFLKKINQQNPGKNYRLPTEAEWEFAARGGNLSKNYQYSGGNNLDDVAWHYTNSGSKTHPIAQKTANELGIFDMSGNVYEWCSDRYGTYPLRSQSNPTGASSGSDRVVRGGSWRYAPAYARVAYRSRLDPAHRYSGAGCRLVRTR